jgi:hypothetical protein
MAGAPLIGKKSMYELREYFVGCVLREIELEFDAADISCDTTYEPPVSGQRRSLVEQYYHSIDPTSPRDVQKLLKVFEAALIRLDERIAALGERKEDPETRYCIETRERLIKYLKRDGYLYSDGFMRALGDVTLSAAVEQHAATFDAPYLRTQLQRLQEAVDTDPRLAISTAKSLVETTCKTILTERGIPFPPAAEVADLVKAVRKALKLVPEDIPDSSKGAETIKRLLTNLATISQSLAELRNLYGSDHGPHGKAKGLAPRHARLAAGAAATLVTFLFETHQERGT